jgi:hypothetical protein
MRVQMYVNRSWTSVVVGLIPGHVLTLAWDDEWSGTTELANMSERRILESVLRPRFGDVIRLDNEWFKWKPAGWQPIAAPAMDGLTAAEGQLAHALVVSCPDALLLYGVTLTEAMKKADQQPFEAKYHIELEAEPPGVQSTLQVDEKVGIIRRLAKRLLRAARNF